MAVLDTGVRFDHPDMLAGERRRQLLPGYDMVSDIGTANDGDGRDADASDPGDWVTAEDSRSEAVRRRAAQQLVARYKVPRGSSPR